MKKDREFENILDECLENMLRGKTIEQCLADYPDHAAALEPMLRTAYRARMATNIQPRPEFKDRARHQFQATIREMEPKPARTRVHHGFFPSLRPVWIALAAIVAIIIAGGGTVYAAGGALPDSPLYSVKLATEQVRLFFTWSDIGKAELYAEFADERVEEIIKMAEEGKVELAEAATNRLNEQLVAIANLTIGDKGMTTNGGMLSIGAAESSRNGQETVPTATMAPTTVPGTTSVMNEPAPNEDTQLGVSGPPATVTDNALSATSEGRTDEQENGDLERKEKLKEQLLRQAIENPEALLKALETAPESLRDILLWAIEVVNAGYDEAIGNLE
jgi:hypothetical protein